MLNRLPPQLDFVMRRWPLFALLASAMLLAAAHAFQTFGGLQPCHLCLKQREVYWLAIVISLGVIVAERFAPDWKGPSPRMLLTVVFLFSAGLAAFHAGVEWKWWPGPESCTSAGGGKVSLEAMQAMMQGKTPVTAPMCDKAPWVFLGLSMAGWNALISLGLAALSMLAVLRHREEV